MATPEGMSGIDLVSVISEWEGLLPFWVNKVYLFSPTHLVIRLHGQEHARYNLLIENGRRVHFTRDLPVPPKLPASFAMLLRKYLTGGKVLCIGQLGIQRIFVLDIGKHGTVFHLVVELFDDGNVILSRSGRTGSGSGISLPVSSTGFRHLIPPPFHRKRLQTSWPAMTGTS
jgi:predicted ribosome quality control (RQC) complex YloA/Tae2 family protein